MVILLYLTMSDEAQSYHVFRGGNGMKKMKITGMILAVFFTVLLPAAEEPEVLAYNAILPVNIEVSDAQPYLAKDFHVLLENSLLANGVRLHNMQKVQNILARNKLGHLNAMEPRWFIAVGKLLQVRALIMVTVTRFELIEKTYHVEETGANGVRYTGFQEGFVRVISAQSGEVLASIPFEQQVDFRKLPRTQTRDWESDDYYRHMTKDNRISSAS